MAEFYKTLGNAKKFASLYADRDGCDWKVWVCNRGYSSNTSFVIETEFSNKPLWAEKVVYTATPLSTLDKPVYLTQEEKELVEFILRDVEDREGYPGSAEVKESLWQKLRKNLGIEKE